METGQLIFRKNNNLTQNSNLELSIQVSLNGLSFSILNRNTNTITKIKHIDFLKKETPFYALDKLKHVFEEEESLKTTFSKVIVIHQNQLSTIVPNALFKEDTLADYLKFNAKILQTDFITFDEVTTNESVNVYVPYVNINNYLFERFGAFTYKHATTILIENLLQDQSNDSNSKMIVNVITNRFDLLIIKKNKLEFYNSFEFNSKEDFLYYILFTAEQLKLDPETFQLEMLGAIRKDDELHAIAYKYIRHINFGNRLDNYNYTEDKPISSYSDYTLLKSF